MSTASPFLLLHILLSRGRSEALKPAQWDLLLRQARRANLSARLALALADRPVPAAVRPHLDSALLLAERQREATQREVAHIQQALRGCAVPLVLLKGAAYSMAGLQAAQGRMFADVDILVPRGQLAQVEKALLLHGWDFGELDAYDNRYYRQWMHELPPLQHARRGTTVDVHHTLLPPTGRIRIDDSAALFERLQPLAAPPGLAPAPRLYTLPPVDMLLHSAAHLFHEGEFDNGLRDLLDLDALVHEFAAVDADFWPRLLARAEQLGLLRPLHHALRYAGRLLGTPVPPALLQQLSQRPGASPGPTAQWLLDRCFERALRPRHASCCLPGESAALAALYVRSHWLRMPGWRLARHLGRKQIRRWLDGPPQPSQA